MSFKFGRRGKRSKAWQPASSTRGSDSSAAGPHNRATDLKGWRGSSHFPHQPQTAGNARATRNYLTSHTVCYTVFIEQHVMHTNGTNSEQFENLRLELRRGCLAVAVLVQLRTELYGYAIRKALSDQGLAIDENTLYPLLRRLESQGLLVSQWREEDKRNKRFYRLSPVGEEVLASLLAEWRQMNTALERILAVPAGQKMQEQTQ